MANGAHSSSAMLYVSSGATIVLVIFPFVNMVNLSHVSP